MAYFDLAAERRVLGSLLLDRQAFDEVRDILKVEHFYGNAHARMYAAFIKLHQRTISVDAVTLAQELDDCNLLEDIGGVPYILEILECVANAARAREEAEIVRDKWIERMRDN